MQWLGAAKPDVVCLQELKCTDAEFPVAAINKAGYQAAWRGQRTWNGVAILSKGAAPVVTRTNLPGDPTDTQARYIEAAVAGILIGCLYLPNGNPQPGPKFDYKLAWFKRLQRHARGLLKQGVPVILAGDYNVAPTEIDIYPTTSWDDDALVQPASRAAYARLVAQGWTDAIRETHGDERVYGHAVRFALDLLSAPGRSKFPYSLYAIGMSGEWAFEEPFQTYPIMLEGAQGWGEMDAEDAADNLAQALEILSTVLPKKSEQNEPSAAA